MAVHSRPIPKWSHVKGLSIKLGTTSTYHRSASLGWSPYTVPELAQTVVAVRSEMLQHPLSVLHEMVVSGSGALVVGNGVGRALEGKCVGTEVGVCVGSEVGS